MALLGQAISLCEFPLYRSATSSEYVVRYIHANPKNTNVHRGYFYDFSNYGSHERLTQDGLTQWQSIDSIFSLSSLVKGDKIAVL